MSLDSALEFLLPDELFEEVMRTMTPTWLRERARAIEISDGPDAAIKAQALNEAADELEANAQAAEAPDDEGAEVGDGGSNATVEPAPAVAEPQ